ncbi:hypothetical protein GC163_14970 [bacterium]|nr:hypothetical protein [bacterium]
MYGVLLHLLQPYGLGLWGLTISLLWVYWRYREYRRSLRWPVICLAIVLIDSLPISVWCTNTILERQFPRVTERPAELRAIVVLGGGAIPPRSEQDVTRPGLSSLLRALRAAELYHQGPPCLVVVSGGWPDPEGGMASAGATMVDVLVQNGVSVADIVLEERSRNTSQNAAFSAEILRERGITDHVALVTSAAHLWRSERLFRREKIAVTPVGCDYHTDKLETGVWLFWPAGDAVSMNQDAFHEYLGMVAYACLGRF